MKRFDLHEKNNFEQFYLFYFPKLVRFATEYVLSAEDAENIVQDVFLVLWEQKDSFHVLKNDKAYLFRLTKNKCIDFLRHMIMSAEKKKDILETQLSEYRYNLYSMEQFDETRWADADTDRLIQDAIDSLPDKCREIFILSRFDGMSHREIADKLGVSSATVNNQITNAMKKLKEKLKDYSFLLYLLPF